MESREFTTNIERNGEQVEVTVEYYVFIGDSYHGESDSIDIVWSSIDLSEEEKNIVFDKVCEYLNNCLHVY